MPYPFLFLKKMATTDYTQEYKKLIEKPLEVFEVFKDFFGEDRVDLQELCSLEAYSAMSAATRATVETVGTCFILVYWPHVQVTNEHNRSEDIYKLYAKVEVRYDGRLYSYFRLNRAEYTVKHIMNNYMHSHISSIPVSNFEHFEVPCTGSGPINLTMHSLGSRCNLDLWRLFCLELDRFVQVESLSGGPYHRLESLRNVDRFGSRVQYEKTHDSIKLTTSSPYFSNFLFSSIRTSIAEFTVYLINRGVLKFTNRGNGFGLAMSPEDFYTIISNEYITWLNRKFAGVRNSELRNMLTSLLVKVKKDNGFFYVERQSGGRNIANLRSYEGRTVCQFKGQTINLHILDLESTAPQIEDANVSHLLNKDVACFILTKILLLLNYKYGKDTNETSTNQRTLYL